MQPWRVTIEILSCALTIAVVALGCGDESGVPGRGAAGSGGSAGAGGSATGGAGSGGGLDATLDDATRAIRNKYFGCDPDSALSCTAGEYPDPSHDPTAEAMMLERLGRPTTAELQARWCLDAEADAPTADAGCRHFAKDAAGNDLPVVTETTSPSHGAGLRAFAAAFERGLLVAHSRNGSWRVFEVFDEVNADPETDEPAPIFTLYARTLEPAGSASFLGLPDSSPVAGAGPPTQQFVNGPCSYSVVFEAVAQRFAIALETGDAECAVPVGLEQIGAVSLLINGHRLRAPEERAIRYIAERVVPRLEGTRADKLRVAGRVSWWSLKEGVLMLQQPIPYSNCHDDTTGTDSHIGPLEVCNTNIAWQVGMAGVQVIYQDPAAVAAAIAPHFAGATVADVLEGTAWDAFADDPTTRQGIMNATGELQHSWLLRNPVLGIVFEEPPVSNECVAQSLGWCFGCGWATSCRYAPTKTEALGSMEDICRALNILAPLVAGESRTDYTGGCSG